MIKKSEIKREIVIQALVPSKITIHPNQSGSYLNETQEIWAFHRKFKTSLSTLYYNYLI